MNLSTLPSIFMWSINTFTLKKLPIINASLLHLTHLTTKYNIKHSSTNIRSMSGKSYFARVTLSYYNRGSNPLISRIIGIEPTLKNSKFFLPPHFTIFYSKVNWISHWTHTLKMLVYILPLPINPIILSLS